MTIDQDLRPVLWLDSWDTALTLVILAGTAVTRIRALPGWTPRFILAQHLWNELSSSAPPFPRLKKITVMLQNFQKMWQE